MTPTTTRTAATIEIEPRTARCECGQATGVTCEWVGDQAALVTVEWMPEDLRGRHADARNHGAYPQNGALRLRVTPKCAKDLIEDNEEWAKLVNKEQ